jgi:cystathionine beta-lyase
MVSELIRLWSHPGDGVVVHTPAYDAFYKAIEGNARHVVPVEMEKHAAGWQGNMAALEAAWRNRKTKFCCCAARKTQPARSGRGMS